MLSQDIAIADVSGLFALLIPAWLVLWLWCSAQSLGELSAISRRVHKSLSVPMGAESETLAESLRFTRSRKFPLLGSAAIQWVISAVLSAVSLFVYISALGMIVFGFGAFSGEPVPGLFLGGGALLLISIILLTWFSIWVAVRLLVTEQSLAIEQNSGAIASIGRSWKLMKKHALRAVGVMLLAGLICLPVLVVTSVAIQLGQAIVFRLAGVTISEASSPAVLFLSSAVSYATGLLSSIISGIITAPFLRAVVTTLYFDIRNRKEILEA